MSVTLAWTILDIFNWVILGYFVAINGVYLVTSIFAFRALLHYTRRLKVLDAGQVTAGIEPPITLIAAAFNEEKTCVESIRSFLNLAYSDFEVIAVNDGSTDQTLDRLRAAYQLEPAARVPTALIPVRSIRGIYQSRTYPQLWVIDKENGGKADALNAGINCCRTPLFAAMDADTLLERDALPRIVRPFIEDTRTGAVGGIIRIANGCTIKDGVVTEIKLPRSWLARFQAIEYMRAFLSGRMGWDAADSTLIISGAFGVFRRQLVVEAGGYRRDTVGEDMELVVRLHRHCRQEKLPLRIGFVPDPVAWTQVPETMAGLGRQRDRWQRGLTESLSRHRSLLFNPRYGKIGMLAFPYFYLLEMFGPVIEFCGYLTFFFYAICHVINPLYATAFVLLAFFLGVAISMAAVGLGEISFRRYSRKADVMLLFVLAIIENFGYRQLVNFYRIRGLMSALFRFKTWGKQERTAFVGADPMTAAEPAAVQPEPAELTAAPPAADEPVTVVCLVDTRPAAEEESMTVVYQVDARPVAAESETVVCLVEASAAEAAPVPVSVLTQGDAPPAVDESVRAARLVAAKQRLVAAQRTEQATLAAEVDRVRTAREETLTVQSRLAAELDRQRAKHAALTQTMAAETDRRALLEAQRRERDRREQARVEAMKREQGEREAAAMAMENELAAVQAREQKERAAAEMAMANELAALRAREQAEWQATQAAAGREQDELTAVLERLQVEEDGLRRRIAVAQPAEQAALAAELVQVRSAGDDTLAVQARLTVEMDRQRAEHESLTQAMMADNEQRVALDGELARLLAVEQELQQRVASAQPWAAAIPGVEPAAPAPAAPRTEPEKPAAELDGQRAEFAALGREPAAAAERRAALDGELTRREQDLAVATVWGDAMISELAQREQTLAALRAEEQTERDNTVALRKEQAALRADQERLRGENEALECLRAAQRGELEQTARTLAEQQAEQAALAAETGRLREECAILQAERGKELPTGAVAAGAPETRYYVNRDGQQYGPATLTELGDLVRTSRVSPNDWIWLDLRQDWVQLHNFSPAAALFAAA